MASPQEILLLLLFLALAEAQMMFIFVVVAEARRLETFFFVRCEYLIFLFARASDEDDAGKTPREHAEEENISRVFGVMRSLFSAAAQNQDDATLIKVSFYKCTRTVLKKSLSWSLSNSREK
jgi:GTPase SAR1 family protein